MLDWITGHPLETIVIIANVISNAFRMAYPVQDERPRWVLFAMALVDPAALNFWTPVQEARKK